MKTNGGKDNDFAVFVFWNSRAPNVSWGGASLARCGMTWKCLTHGAHGYMAGQCNQAFLGFSFLNIHNAFERIRFIHMVG